MFLNLFYLINNLWKEKGERQTNILQNRWFLTIFNLARVKMDFILMMRKLNWCNRFSKVYLFPKLLKFLNLVRVIFHHSKRNMYLAVFLFWKNVPFEINLVNIMREYLNLLTILSRIRRQETFPWNRGVNWWNNPFLIWANFPRRVCNRLLKI